MKVKFKTVVSLAVGMTCHNFYRNAISITEFLFNQIIKNNQSK